MTYDNLHWRLFTGELTEPYTYNQYVGIHLVLYAKLTFVLFS